MAASPHAVTVLIEVEYAFLALTDIDDLESIRTNAQILRKSQDLLLTEHLVALNDVAPYCTATLHVTVGSPGDYDLSGWVSHGSALTQLGPNIYASSLQIAHEKGVDLVATLDSIGSTKVTQFCPANQSLESDQHWVFIESTE